MKLYRIRTKKAFVTATKIEPTYWTPETELATTPKVYLAPGVPVEVCEMVAAHWAYRRVVMDAYDEEIKTIKKAWTEKVERTIPGYWEKHRRVIPAHYETKEIWVDEHEAQRLVEVPGYYETRRVQEPGQYEIQHIWVPEYYVTRFYWVEAHPARGIEAHWRPYQKLIPAGYKDQRVWVEGRWVQKEFWVDTTWETQTVTIPGQFTDQRVWIETEYRHENIWTPPRDMIEVIEHPEEEVTTIVAVPEKIERQRYWQEEYVVCHQEPGPDKVMIGTEAMVVDQAFLEKWLQWYANTPEGLESLKLISEYGRINQWDGQTVLAKAFLVWKNGMKVQPVRNILQRHLGESFSSIMDKLLLGKPEYAAEFNKEALQKMWGHGALVALAAASAALITATWPGAKYDFTVTYSRWTYILRYQETFQYANLVGVSPGGRPYYHGCLEWGGPIMGEEWGPAKDIWHFGQEWRWSVWEEEARWMGISETRYWYEAEVEYLGMVSRSGANFYTKYEGITEETNAYHEPGWTLPSAQWEIIEEEWWHQRI